MQAFPSRSRFARPYQRDEKPRGWSEYSSSDFPEVPAQGLIESAIWLYFELAVAFWTWPTGGR